MTMLESGYFFGPPCIPRDNRSLPTTTLLQNRRVPRLELHARESGITYRFFSHCQSNSWLRGPASKIASGGA